MTETEITDLKKNIKNVSTGSLQCRYNKKTYYLVYEPTGINDWTIVALSIMMLWMPVCAVCSSLPLS